jgi:GNAT superfamily N-acetyltransferase
MIIPASGEPIPLIRGYTAATLPDDQFQVLFAQMLPLVFSDEIYLHVPDILSQGEKDNLRRLTERLGALYRLHIGIYDEHGAIVGTSFGCQAERGRYNMVNTGILPNHQNRGIYTALLPHILATVREEGFQEVYSSHLMTNNQVIIPKLKAGFVISGFSVSDRFGTLVELAYFFNERRREAMDFRTGFRFPGPQLAKHLDLGPHFQFREDESTEAG